MFVFADKPEALVDALRQYAASVQRPMFYVKNDEELKRICSAVQRMSNE